MGGEGGGDALFFFFLFSLSSSRRPGLTSEPCCRGLRALDAAPIDQGSLTYRETPLDRIRPLTI